MRASPVVLTLCAVLSTSVGATAPVKGGQVPPSGHPCPHGEANALSELGCELRRQLELPEGTLLATAPLTTDVPIERSTELVERMLRVLGGTLGATLKLHTTPVPLGEARRLASRSGRLLYLTPELREGRLRLTADVYEQARAFWDRVKAPESGPVQHAYAERLADAELRSFLPRPPLLVSRKDSAPLPERPLLSMACGSSDPNQGELLYFVGRRRISAGRLRGGKLEKAAEVEWQELSPIAPAPLRAPLAQARVGARGFDVGSSDRAEAFRLGPRLEVLARNARALPWPDGGCAPLGPVGAEPRAVPCFGEPAEELPFVGPDPVPTSFDAFTAARLVRPDGSATRVVAYRPTAEADARLIDASGRRVTVPDVGAQLALADLDGDGQIELISSRPVQEPEQDTIRVDTWTTSGELIERYQIPLPDVQAIAVCSWPGTGLTPIAVASKERVWVLR